MIGGISSLVTRQSDSSVQKRQGTLRNKERNWLFTEMKKKIAKQHLLAWKCGINKLGAYFTDANKYKNLGPVSVINIQPDASEELWERVG